MRKVSSFYNKVMGIQLKPKSKFKPKGKGKSGKTPQFETNPDIEDLDVFLAILERDAGKESQHQKEDFFNIHLKNLSKSKLNKLTQKVEKVRDYCLVDEEKHQRLTSAHRVIDDAIQGRLRISESYEQEIRAKIQKKLKELFERQELKIDKMGQLYIKNKKTTLKKMINDYFQDEVNDYNFYVAQNLIIPERENRSGKTFVTNEINSTMRKFRSEE